MPEFAIDIETIPNRDVEIPEVDTGRLVDPEKIQKKKDEAKSKMALDPFTGRICCYAAANKDETGGDVLTEISDEAEKHLLVGLFKYMKRGEFERPRIVTWNGNGFDIPFIYKRAMILGLDLFEIGVMPMNYWMKRYSVLPHCDLMQVFCNWYGYLKLDTAAQMVLGETKTAGIDVCEFLSMIENGNGAVILDYCKQDTELTYKLFEKAGQYLF